MTPSPGPYLLPHSCPLDLPTHHPLGFVSVFIQKGLVSSTQSCVERKQFLLLPHRPSFLPLSACLRLPCLVVQKQSSQKEPEDSPAFISKSCCQESHQDPPKMKGFLFLLFTISLLVMIQVRAAPQSPWHHCPGLPSPAWHRRKVIQASAHPAFSQTLQQRNQGLRGPAPSLPGLLAGVRLLEGCP